ncbi:MAG: AAA family ATPase, partial [Candidatus Diapherotrites archaeon]|nr:AAA family ATPase [Candidatus Diapherotrites archaeon]
MKPEKQLFYNRAEELELINSRYAEMEKHAQGAMLAIYGRRRVGKTELVKKFMEGKPECQKLYFYVDLAEKKVLLGTLAKAVFEQLHDAMSFEEFDDFFTYLAEKTKKEPLILAIDEFQRFTDVAPEAITMLQKHWDNTLKAQKLFALLVGSSIGMMQKITESSAGALYGRATKIK